ncbi:hypothetical protein Hanom_Chr06g00542221 [Helianthus anomalus]
MAWTFSGFTLKPPFVTMKPKNFPSSMPKEHLAGFNFIFTLRNELNVFRCPSTFGPLRDF